MAGALLDSQLIELPKAHLGFALAGTADEAEIRRLLRANPTCGRISLSFEREPNYFSDARVPGEEKQSIIAHENVRIACIGSCTVRQRFVNGQPRRVGYLGGLRLDTAFAGRFDILRRGYAFFREIQSAAPADFYFTSIAADNERARRFLERGLPGMPRYEFLAEFVSVVIKTVRRTITRSPRAAVQVQLGEERLSHVNTHNRAFQLSPNWSADELAHLKTLGLQHFVTLEAQGKVVAGAALWDQGNYKQTVIRGYSAPLAFARPAVNLAALILGQPRLPRRNTVLANAVVTQLVVDPNDSAALIDLIHILRERASQCGLDLITLGFADDDPRLETVRSSFTRREYSTRLYLVRWPKLGGSISELDNRLLAPEVALL